jgi:hypothetical protein
VVQNTSRGRETNAQAASHEEHFRQKETICEEMIENASALSQ